MAQFGTTLQGSLEALEKARDVEKFINDSQAMILERRSAIKVLDGVIETKSKAKDDIDVAVKETRSALSDDVSKIQRFIQKLNAERARVEKDLDDFKAKIESERNDIVSQKQSLQASLDKLNTEIESKSRLLSNLQQRIENANAALSLPSS